MPTRTRTITGPTRDTDTVTVTTTAEPSTQTLTTTATVTQTDTVTHRDTVTRTETVRPPTPASGAAESSDGQALRPWQWLVVVLVLLGIAALVVWWVRRHRERTEWDGRLATARTDARWVEGTLVDRVTGAVSTAEAGRTWQAAQPRVMALDATLYELSTTAPDEDRAAAATTLRQHVAALASAVDAETSLPPGASADQLRARQGAVASARAQLRGLLEEIVQHR